MFLENENKILFKKLQRIKVKIKFNQNNPTKKLSTSQLSFHFSKKSRFFFFADHHL